MAEWRAKGGRKVHRKKRKSHSQARAGRGSVFLIILRVIQRLCVGGKVVSPRKISEMNVIAREGRRRRARGTRRA